MLNRDNEGYWQFTGPMRLDKAVHTLEGLVRGIALDGRVDDREVAALDAWFNEHRELARFHPFNEFANIIQSVIADGIIDEGEKADLLWILSRLGRHNNFYDDVTSDMQRFQGIMAGITADGQINHDELVGLRNWMEKHSHLRTRWPYDEVDAVITAVLKDGRIDEDEHRQLLTFFGEFADLPHHRSVELREPGEDATPTTLPGICAACPEITFTDRSFCFTGTSVRLTRTAFATQIAQLGGQFAPDVTRKVHYLVVGADGNPCWAYACYGRKVEQAIKLRREGLPILIVHENDYWDAVQDCGAS